MPAEDVGGGMVRPSVWTGILSNENAADGKDWSAVAKAGSRIATGRSAGSNPESARLVIAILASREAAFSSDNRANDNVANSDWIGFGAPRFFFFVAPPSTQ